MIGKVGKRTMVGAGRREEERKVGEVKKDEGRERQGRNDLSLREEETRGHAGAFEKTEQNKFSFLSCK
jgi:hypothetical protein